MRKYGLIWLLIMLFIGTFSVYATSLSDYDLVAQNGFLELFVNYETAEIAVYDMVNDEFWYSNPPDRQQMEKIARGKALERLGAQLVLTYFTQVGAEITLDSYNDSVIYNQMEFINLEDGIRVDFTFGEEWSEGAFIPNVMTASRFEAEILAKVTDEKQREFLLEQYVKVWFEEKPRDYTPVQVTQVNKERILGGKTLMSEAKNLERRNAKRDLYNNLFDHIVGRADVSRRSEITSQIMAAFMEEPIYMLGSRVSRWDQTDIANIMREIGFLPLNRAEDLKRFGYSLDGIEPNHRVFNAALEYLLDGPDLVVRVPLDSISYPQNAIDPREPETPPVTLPIYSITVLPFFGAANRETEGYLFVPDGPGALINLNNGKTDSSSVTINVYGRDNAINRTEQMRKLVPNRLPVFGMNQNNRGFLGIIEAGDAVARIKADVAGRVYSYNFVHSEFVVMPKGSAHLQTTDVFTQEVVIAVPQSRPVLGDFQIRYSFLPEERSNYVGMAHQYQSYLEGQGLKPTESEKEPPFYLELVGAIQVKRPILGVPQVLVRSLTSYEEVEKIVAQLMEVGVENLKIRYKGWLNGGVDHDFPKRIKWEKAVGGKTGFIELTNIMKAKGVEIFPDVSFVTVKKNRTLDGFFPSRDAGRFLDRTIAKSYNFDRATYQIVKDDYRYLLSPPRLGDVIDRFLEDYFPIAHQYLSLDDLAFELNSDFRYNPTKLTDRQQAKTIVLKQFPKFAEYELLINGGFAFALPFASHVINAPTKGNGFPMIDEIVPFYQILLRGFVNYTGEAFNFSHDPELTKLKAVETGSYPYFVWSYTPSSATKHTDYNDLYSLYYGDWIADAASIYEDLHPLLQLVQGQKIIGHRQVKPGLYKTTYENGIFTYVNYTDRALYQEGLWIKARDYKVGKGGS